MEHLSMVLMLFVKKYLLESKMKYLLITLLTLIFLGCSKQDESKSSISDTSSLQPNGVNKELQPPRPPAL